MKIGNQTPTSPHNDYKLSVDGKVLAKSFYVTNIYWADFVFDNNYKLKPLKEVEDYINKYKCLPDTPSQNYIETTGADVGEILKLHMQKIEELTLYILQLQKEIEILKKK